MFSVYKSAAYMCTSVHTVYDYANEKQIYWKNSSNFYFLFLFSGFGSNCFQFEKLFVEICFEFFAEPKLKHLEEIKSFYNV